MAADLDNSIRRAAELVTSYIGDASELSVTTKFVEVNENSVVNFDEAKAAARTIIRFDGDSSVVVPMARNEAGELEIDSSLFGLHERNVQTAIEYRTGLLEAILDVLQEAF